MSPVARTGAQPRDDERGVMTSTGVGARVNLFGYMVVEIDYVRAFGLDNGWQWQFNAIPGF